MSNDTNPNWNKIIELLPQIEAAAYRRYPSAVGDFLEAGVDALLKMDPDKMNGPDAHTDSYLIQNAVFAATRKLWPDFARGVWEFTDLVNPSDDQSFLDYQASLVDESYQDEIDQEEMSDAISEIVKFLPAQELAVFHALQEAVANGEKELFFKSGRIRQSELAKRCGIPRSSVNRAMNYLSEVLAPVMGTQFAEQLLAA